MAFDGLVIYTLAEEMRDRLTTARVDKIYQPDPETVTVAMRGRGENIHVLFSANAQHPRVHFTGEKFINPPHPPAFTMLLRKYLTSGRVLEILQPGFERVLQIVIQNLNDEGELVNYRLIIEMMGRHSNLILLDENDHILDGVKRVSADVSRHREVLPGRPYVNPPEQDKANPLMADEAPFKALLQLDLEAKLFQGIMTNYRGISPLIAKEICVRAGLAPEGKVKELGSEEFDRLWLAFESIFADLRNRRTAPTLVEDETGRVIAYSCFELEQFAEMKQLRFPSMSELLDYYFGKKIKRQALDQFSGDLRKLVGNLLEKDMKKREKLRDQLDAAQNSEDLRIKGEMLTANIHLAEKGAASIAVVNYYDPDMREITIELDPALSPQANAQKYFKRYNKLKKSIEYVLIELEKLDREIDYLKNVELSLEQVESPLDIEEIREELISEGYLRENRRATPNRSKLKSKPMRFTSSAGFDILVGRNNRQNDELSKKIAARDDLWFHVKEMPGSHVIIRNVDRQEVPAATITEAAVIAAYFSKARASANVPVDYTQIRNVNKPKGAKPGMVIYLNYQTAVVTPDEALVERLKKPE